jgi:hypothetical protein
VWDKLRTTSFRPDKIPPADSRQGGAAPALGVERRFTRTYLEWRLGEPPPLAGMLVGKERDHEFGQDLLADAPSQGDPAAVDPHDNEAVIIL